MWYDSDVNDHVVGQAQSEQLAVHVHQRYVLPLPLVPHKHWPTTKVGNDLPQRLLSFGIE